MNEEFSHNPMIDNELQVRLMNLVMGEASDFERDQLQTMMEQRAELAAYYQHLKHLHGLLSDVGAGDPATEVAEPSTDDVWQLPSDKREHLLAVLDGKVESLAAKVVLGTDRKVGRRALRSRWYAVAAMVTAACVLSALTLNSYQATRHFALARRAEQSVKSQAYYLDNTQSMPVDAALPALMQEAATKGLQVADSATSQDANVNLGYRSQRENGSERYFSAPAPTNTAADVNADAARDSVWFDAMRVPDAPESPRTELFGVYEQGAGAPSTGGDMNAPSVAVNSERATVTDAEGATVMLGGIKRFYKNGQFSAGPTESKAKVDGEPPVAMKVTPRIVISEEEEKILLGRTGSDDAVGRALQEQVKQLETQIAQSGEGERDNLQAGQAVDGRAAGDRLSEQLSQRMDPVGTREVETPNFYLYRGAVQPDQPQSNGQQNSGQPSSGQQSPGQQSSTQQTGSQPSDNAPSKSEPEALAIGDDTNGMFGNVQTEFIEDLDLVIIKGAERDVSRTLDVIDGIEKQKLQEGKDVTPWEASSGKVMATEEMKQEIRDKLDAMRAKQPKSGAESKSDEKQRASLVENYNELMSEGRYAEAELIAKKVGQMNPGSQTGQLMAQNAGRAKQQAGSVAGITNADDYIDLMNRVDSARFVPEGFAKADAADGYHWKFTPPPSPQVASKTRGRNEFERKSVERKPAEAIDEQSAATQAFSTFSLHVSDVAFKLAQSALAQGQWPEAAKIRIEEFVNAIDYHDPLPTGNEKVACRIEQAMHPFLMQRNLLRISMRTAATGRAQNTPLRLTIVLDNSGSMERADRRQAVLQAVQMLAAQLRPADQVTLISFANTPRLLAEKVTGDQGASLVKLIENLPSEGGTNIEAAMTLAREKALEQQVAGAQNRIVLLTDGAVNLGNADPDSLAKLVTQLRDAGIAFDAAGISAADLNDEVLEALTRQGDGRYYLLDSADTVADSFAAQIAGALRPSAQNVKVQVEFNPQRVGRYKLLGFEKHRLKQEDFRNDKVDAAEMAAAEAGVAVYHYEIKPNGSGDVGSVSVRFRDLATGQMIERRWPIPYESSTTRLEQASPTMQLAAIAALFATKLSGGPAGDSVDLEQLQQLVTKVPEQYANQPRVVQLRTMVEQAQAIQK